MYCVHKIARHVLPFHLEMRIWQVALCLGLVQTSQRQCKIWDVLVLSTVSSGRPKHVLPFHLEMSVGLNGEFYCHCLAHYILYNVL